MTDPLAEGSVPHTNATPAAAAGGQQAPPPVFQPRPLPEWAQPGTISVRAGTARSQFDETSEALFLNSGYVYASADAAEAAFTGGQDRFVYSRYGNPTVAMFQERLRQLDGTEACFATASGMAAVFVALGALCPAGSRLVASRSLFGSCFVICNEILPRWGVEVEFVDGPDLEQWRRALSVPTAAVFFESPSNPMQELVDIPAVVELAHAAGAQVVLDNVFATPLLQRGVDLGVDVIVYSGTKHIDGQGRVMGGAILGRTEYIDGPVKTLMRHTGPALSPFNAWVMLKGLETLDLRVQRMNDTAHALAEFLDAHPAVGWVRYPFLDSHPQSELARRQMRGGGSIVTFSLARPDISAAEAKRRAFAVANALQIVDISNNLGDAKSLLTHPATTTHNAMGPEGRAAIGLDDGVLRLSAGLETAADLRRDLDEALAAALRG